MRNRTTFKRRLAGGLIVVMIGLFAVPTVAAAQQIGPTSGQYDDTLAQVGGGAEDPRDPSDPKTGLNSKVGPLPFTGFDVIAMAAVALAVTGLGLALQRAVSRDPADRLS